MRTKANSHQETLNQSIDRHSKTSHLKLAREELSKKWLNQRRMNTQRRRKERSSRLDSATMTPDENFGKGVMYFFKYDARTKMKLPYFDEYPLILPFDFKGDLMYAINTHYLPPKLRAVVLDFIIKAKQDGLRASPQQIVRALANNPIFKPAIHSYYPSNIVSNVQEIPSSEWENVIFLPLANFVSYTKTPHSQQKVYSDYMAKI